MENFVQDLRYGLRTLTRSPGFTIVAVLSLALGIGANTAIFSVIDGVLLNRLPYPDANRLVIVWEQNPGRGWFHNIVSAANFRDWRSQNRAFSGMSAIDERSYDVSGTGEPLEVEGEQVTANLFSVLGVEPALGRSFQPEEDQPGSARVVVLSNDLWKQRYGGDRSIVGREITLNHERFTVIGVMPPGFYFPPFRDRARLWVAGLDLSQPVRDWHEYVSVARLKPGVRLAQAQAEMDTIARGLEKAHPEQKGWGVQLITLHEEMVGDTRPALLVLLGAVGMVLLIACANLANLQLARVLTREREIAVRSTLGAARGRIVRQLVTENVLLAIAGGGLGLLLVAWGVKFLAALAPQNTPGLERVGLNAGVLGFTLILSIATGLAFGLVPALGASRVDLNRSLKEGSRGTTGGARHHRLRRVLVSAEFALALMLLAGAGLMIRTFIALNRVDLGFDPHHVLTMGVTLLGPRYEKRERQAEFFRDLLRSVESLPGVQSAAVIDGGGLPPDGGNGDGFLIVGRPKPPMSQWPDAVNRVISPDYFRTMGIPLVKGRYFTDADAEDAPRVVIINEKLARDYWPGRNPLGSQLMFPGADKIFSFAAADKASRFTIVGVVKGEKNRGLEAQPDEELYIPYTQKPTYYMPRTLLVRSTGDPAALVASIRHQVELLDPEQPISDIATMDHVMTQAEAGHRFPMVLLGLFAALALVLAGVGIYGVISYSVTQRLHEIGIRMALGAAHRDVLASLLRQGVALAAAGIGTGLAGALLLTQLMSRLLFGVRPTDPLTLAVVSLALGGVGVLASLIPARRAAKVDPMIALRYE
jgi:putative ABC transport system permease protein